MVPSQMSGHADTPGGRRFLPASRLATYILFSGCVCKGVGFKTRRQAVGLAQGQQLGSSRPGFWPRQGLLVNKAAARRAGSGAPGEPLIVPGSATNSTVRCSAPHPSKQPLRGRAAAGGCRGAQRCVRGAARRSRVPRRCARLAAPPSAGAGAPSRVRGAAACGMARGAAGKRAGGTRSWHAALRARCTLTLRAQRRPERSAAAARGRSGGQRRRQHMRAAGLAGGLPWRAAGGGPVVRL